MSFPPIECLYVNEHSVREWKSGNPNFKMPESVPLHRFVYELCWTIVRGELPFQKCKTALKSVEFLGGISDEDIGSTFADVVTQMAQDITMVGENRTRLAKLSKWLVESSLVPLHTFHERAEEEFLWECEMIKMKAHDLKSKEVRVNTRILYQQTKFNLLREESEGYAKLITLLFQVSEVDNEKATSATIGIIKSLIGHFDLDPNRVFDIVLEALELHSDNSFLDMVPIFPKSHASQILGSKFQYYQHIDVTESVPFGLYRLTALLVKNEFIDLDTIYSHLLPKDDESFEQYNAFCAKRLDEANNIGRINLAATGRDLMDDEKQGDVAVDLYAALDLEAGSFAERLLGINNSQTLGLLAGFLSVDDWFHAQILFDRLSLLIPASHARISDELFRIIEKSITSAYNIVRQMRLQNSGSSVGGCSESIDFNLHGFKCFVNVGKELFEMLVVVGPYLHRNTLLLQKVCRVLKGYYLSALKLQDAGTKTLDSDSWFRPIQNPLTHLKEARARIEEALGKCLLPSLQLIPANPAVGLEIWEVMLLLPYEVRYRLYGEWEKDDEPIPMILAARQTAKLDTRRILKRLVKENLKQLGRMVAKLAHANPLTVLRTIVHQMEAYKDMIIPVVDAFKYLSQLEYDILEYVVIERLAQAGREKLKDDGLNVSDWLQSLASFWGHLCKKYPSMELRGLFQYLVNQLKKGNGIELVLLQELIQQMANVQYTENMTEDQLDAMGGSDTLRYQATSFGIPRNNKALVKSTNRLRDSLLPKEEPVLAIPLLLLIAQHRSVIIINADVSHIKIVGEEFDRCHGTLLQYVEFLTGAAMPVTAYAQSVPSLNDLVCQYHLDPEVAFLIYRPIMRLFKSVGGDISWPLNDIKSEADSGNEKEPEQIESDIDLVLDSGCGGKYLRWSNLLDTIKTMLPSNAWKSLTPDLYATFWGLTLYDLYVPRNCYDSEISKLHATLKSLEEISDNSSSSIAKRKKDKERIQESLDRLTSELQQHEENVASVRRRLTREKDTWLSSCPDTLKINMEFLQRCIFPRCTFSMADAAYCALFVQTLHSLGTPFFNTVNHIDVLICKTLHPMICCCTEFEAGRLGRFLYETLKIAYYWKSDESVYERECGNRPGFAVYYRFPNSQRVTFGQFIKVHWKWSQRITRLLIQCLESTEYMEIRNALILLTKISSVFPVTRKSGINLEKRVLKIKGDEREDLKVLAMGVAAALATRKPFWVTEEEFGMGYLELKPVSSALPKPLNNSVTSAPSVVSQQEGSGSRPALHPNHVKELTIDGLQPHPTNGKTNGIFPVNGPEVSTQLGPIKATANVKLPEETSNRSSEDNSAAKVPSKAALESQARSVAKRQLPPHSPSIAKVLKPDSGRDDYRVGRGVVRSPGPAPLDPHPSEGRPGPTTNTSPSVAANGNTSSVLPKVTSVACAPTDAQGGELRAEAGWGEDNHTAMSSSHPVQDIAAASPLVRPGEKVQKRASSTEDHDRIGRRRRGDVEMRGVETEARFPEKEEGEGAGQEQLEKMPDRSRDRSGEKTGREKSVEILLDRIPNRVKDDRGRMRHGESDKIDERFHGQGFPLPPPHLHPNILHQSLSLGRRDEDTSERRLGTSRHPQRLSPRHDEKDRRRPEGSPLVLHEDGKRRREDEFRDRKVLAMKAEDGERERDQEREKAILMKEEIDGEVISSKRRKLKREHIPSGEVDEYPSAVPHPPLSVISSQPYDVRERGERKSILPQRAGYMEDSGSLRIHVKDVSGKIARRDADIMYDREWDEEKRLRMEAKRRHRK